MGRYYFTRSQTSYWIREFTAILQTYYRISKLKQQLKWAEEKRLYKPVILYSNRLNDIERLLIRHIVFHPRLTKLARYAYRCNRLISHYSKYLPKGSARYYKQRCLTP